MPSLKKSQKVFSGLQFFGNFIERPLLVGDIVLNDDGQHLIWGNIEDVIDGFSLKDKIAISSKANLEFTKESNIEVKFSGTANAKLATGEVELKFNSKNSAFVSLKQVQQTSVKLGLVKEKLIEYWKQKGFDKSGNLTKYHFILSVITAESGTVIFSQEKNNSVVLKAKNNTPITSVALIAGGQVEFVCNSKQTLEIISETPIQPLYQAVRFKSNGKFELVG